MITSGASVVGKSSKAALVAATSHDCATRQLLPAAKDVARMLEKAGYDVLSFYGKEATCTAIYVKLQEVRESGIEVSTGFIAAHGSTKCLHDSHGGVLIDATMCEQLVGAILVIASCLCDGTLPGNCVGNNKSVKACIGFSGKLWTPRQRWWAKLLTPSLSKKALDDFSMCIQQPMCSLLRKRSTQSSTNEAKRLWRKKAGSLRQFDLRIALVFEVNGINLSFWGRGSAKL